MKHTYSSKIIAYRLLEIYQEKVNENLGDMLNSKDFIEYEANSNKFFGMIYSNSLKFIEFWKAYNKPSLVILDLLRLSRKIEKEDILIKNFWLSFKQKDKYFSRSLRLIYGSYLSLVRNASYSGSKLQETTRLDFREKNRNPQGSPLQIVDMLASPDNIILHVSMTRDMVGKILNVSPNILEKLGWNKKELLGKNLNCIMPEFMRESHNLILAKQFEKDTEASQLMRQIDSFVRDKYGNIVPCNIYLCLHPNISQELMFLAVLNIKTSFDEKIVINQEGLVQGFTKDVGQKLGLVINQQRDFRDICINNESLAFFSGRSNKDKYTGLNEKDNTFEEEVMLSIRLRSQLVKDYYVSLSPYTYFGELYYLLTFNSCEYRMKTIIRRQLLRENMIVKDSEDINNEEDTKRDTNGFKIFQENEDEELSIPLEVLSKENDSNFILPLASPTSTAPLNMENQDTNSALRSRTITNANNMFKDKTEESRVREDVGISQRFSYRFQKSSFRRKSSKAQFMETVDKSQSRGAKNFFNNSKATEAALKLEQAAYYIPKDNRMRLLSILFLVLILLTTIVLLVFQYQNTQAMHSVTENVSIVGSSVSRILRIINLYGICILYPLLDSKDMLDTRFAIVGVPSARAISISRLITTSTDLLNFNKKVREMASQLDEKLSQSLFAKFPVLDYYEPGVAVATRKLNSFDLIIEFKVAVQNLISKPSEIKGDSPGISFILNNSFDELLINCEEGVRVIIEDTQMKFGEIDNTMAVFVYLIGVFSLSVWILSLDMIRIFFKYREKILEVFRRLDEKEIGLHVDSVQKFSSLLLKYDMDIKYISLKINKHSMDFEPLQTKHSYIQKEKQANMNGVNSQIIKLLIYILILIILISFGYLAIITTMKKQNDSISRKINLMIHANFGFYYTYLRHAAINRYISQGENITLRSKPFNEEYNRLTTYLADMDTVYLDVIDKEKGFGEDSQLEQLFKGNLCILASTPLRGL